MAKTERTAVEFTKNLSIVWDWDDLFQDATEGDFNLNLAVAGLVMSRNAEFSGQMLEATLRTLGFDRIESEDYLLCTETRNAVSKPARTFGYKKLEKNGKEHHIICAVFKGTTTLEDCITDIKSVEDGFYQAGKDCADSLGEYLGKIDGITKDNTIMFITGHSLGASTANVVGRLAREYVNEKSEFVYAFASPNYETEGEWDDGKDYPNFRYFTNRHDIVPDVPLRLPPHFFSKIGTEYLYNLETLDDDQKQRFERVYKYFRNLTFEEDTDLLELGFKKSDMGFKTLKNHLAHTYMSFILSDLTDAEIDKYFITGEQEKPAIV